MVAGNRKRKLEDGAPYTPSVGRVNSKQFRLAIAEYVRLEKEGVEHGRILVAQRVPLLKCGRRIIPYEFKNTVIEADYGNKKVTNFTRADLLIAKLPTVAHECGR
jgi:hypothetical protein